MEQPSQPTESCDLLMGDWLGLLPSESLSILLLALTVS